jgi:hypothetical protein
MNTLADNADIVIDIVVIPILLILLVYLLVVGIRKIASFFGKKKRQAGIRRKVRSTLIEETTGVSVNERLKAKRKSISRPENVDFCELRSAKKLDLPEVVVGDIYFWSLPKSEYARLSHGPFELGGEVRFEPLISEERWHGLSN